MDAVRKPRFAVMLAAMALAAAAVAAAWGGLSPLSAQATASGNAELVAINVGNVTGTIGFVDDGAQLFAFGEAAGFIPGRQYFSLAYRTAVTTGSGACAVNPNDPNDLTFEQMMLGEWLPVGGDERTLRVDQPKASVRLDQVNTASVRIVNEGEQPIDPTRFLPPQIFLLRACGAIVQN